METLLAYFKSLSLDDYITKKGLLISSISITLLFLAALPPLKSPWQGYALTLLGVFLTANFLTWLYNRKVPKVEAGKLGVMVCIAIHNEEEASGKKDFISHLRGNLSSRKLGRSIQILEVNNTIAKENSETEKANILRIKSGCRLLIFGEMKRRLKNGSPVNILNINAYLTHKALNETSQNAFKQRISKSWDSTIDINDADRNYQLYGITSDLVALSSLYLIGLSALISGEDAIAEQIFLDIKENIGSVRASPAIKEITSNIENDINQVHILRCDRSYGNWRQAREISHIMECKEHLKRIKGAAKRAVTCPH